MGRVGNEGGREGDSEGYFGAGFVCYFAVLPGVFLVSAGDYDPAAVGNLVRDKGAETVRVRVDQDQGALVRPDGGFVVFGQAHTGFDRDPYIFKLFKANVVHCKREGVLDRPVVVYDLAFFTPEPDFCNVVSVAGVEPEAVSASFGLGIYYVTR